MNTIFSRSRISLVIITIIIVFEDVYMNGVHVNLRKTCKQRIDTNDLIMSLTTKFIWKSANELIIKISGKSIIKQYFRFLIQTSDYDYDTMNIVTWCKVNIKLSRVNDDYRSCADVLNECEHISKWITESLWTIKIDMTLEKFNEFIELEHNKIKEKYEKEKKPEEENDLKEYDAEMERVQGQEKEDRKQDDLLVRRYLIFIYQSEDFNMETMNTAAWCRKHELMTCHEILLEKYEFQSIFIQYQMWDLATKMSTKEIKKLNSVERRYIESYRKHKSFDSQDLIDNLKPQKWCYSVDKLCIESIRMAGFNVDIDLSPEDIKLANEFNKNHAKGLTNSKSPRFGYVFDFVNYLLSSITNIPKKVNKWCLDHCVDNLKNSGYKESKKYQNLNKARKMPANIQYKKTFGCARKYTDYYNFLKIFSKDIISFYHLKKYYKESVNAPDLKEWCSAHCI